ncbi:baseplate J/gp47 family protein [Ancylobacter dichloromethanicus]|uniref:Bacteriophage protein n=1 Tax=Ancylobacter dichloromethanicus TaxID=518825 RepID=A0A9W6JCU6_9HYPH|nr:baseplate J/gp47 family protein [Ancylobacter dichloromethanicus]MBS7553714.1 baseplate J/gp47 family protein [Ancylobacter dichloromethanicus]GLK74677.1 bacteriophage protein [Ancylobacter dichloromethanicus]
MSDGVTVKALAGLPPAQVIEELSWQAMVDRMVARFQDLWAVERAANPALPQIDTLHLASDPGRKIIEMAAYVEAALRARINDAGRSNLLFYNEGGDTDHLVVFHDVLRMYGETDEALKSRTILAIAGRSTGGPKERYEAIARAADVRVKHAHAYRIGRDPTIHVAIWSTDNDGMADAALLASVRAALESPAHGLICDTFNVRAAVFIAADITLDVWLLPDALESILEAIPSAVTGAWSSETGMGFDLAGEWVQARAMIAGVRRARMTSVEITAAPYEAISIRSVTASYRGRDY